MKQSRWSENLRSRRVDLVVYLLGGLSLIFSFYATSVGFHHSLFDFHGFRQTQTAIAADSLRHGSSLLHYETPVLGPPWSLPFEFPLYQAVVAGCSQLFATPLDETGRSISILCYYLCFFPLASILMRLGLRGAQMIPALTLFAVSPIYVFVSRLFMIESTVLLLSLLFTDQVFRMVFTEERWQARPVIAAALFGVAAGLVKVTTLAPFFALATVVIFHALWQDHRQGKLKWARSTAVVFCCCLLPVVATVGWTHFADSVKAQNPFGIFLTSKALTAWNFGTLAQRRHPRIYLQLFFGADNHLGSVWAGLIVLAVYLWLCRRANRVAVACVALYIGTMLLFFNLHVVHEYYSYANAVFLVVAAGVLISSLLQMRGRVAWAGVALLMFEMLVCGYRYFTHFYPLQSENDPGRAEAAAEIDRLTQPGDVILIAGLDWSSELPYESHRRAIMDWKYDPKAWGFAPVEAAIANAGRQNITAVVACATGRDAVRLPVLLEKTGMSSVPRVQADDCDIYQR